MRASEDMFGKLEVANYHFWLLTLISDLLISDWYEAL